MDVHESEETKEVHTHEIKQFSSEENSTNCNYKILNDFMKLGCSQKSLVAAAYRTFLDLCETRKFKEVTYHYISELDIIYLKAQNKINEIDFEIIVPVLSSKKVSFKQIEGLQDTFKCVRITLAICDMNSLIMYYKITKN